jgi:spore coat protein U-like protein
VSAAAAQAGGARAIALLLLAALPGAPVHAATDCFVNAVASAAFGIYDGTQNDGATTKISGFCRNAPPPGGGQTLAPTITLSTGLAGSYTQRQMANGTHRLSYNLYSGVARRTVWGDGTAGTVAVPAYAAGSVSVNGNQTRAFDNPGLTIYGRIPAGQDVAIGSYSDTITLTLSF